VKTEDGTVDGDMFELEEALEATEHIQHDELIRGLGYGGEQHLGHGSRGCS
jgi:hypothetical protein